MGKFYVYIKVNTHNIKVNKEDVQQVYSQPKNKHPPLPNYHPIRKTSKTSSLATASSEQEYISV